ncbi:unnamed protein product [Rotaria sp. Silwood2]|nr:unnamed protein product [Rotaria sp. Silwood2]CAF4561412.1 unnamed protein product [Rotaria sp. Silwood2]
MKLTAAQKQKRYRDKLKQNGLHNATKAKNRARMKIARSKLSDFQREQYRKRDAAAHRSARATKKLQSNASFNSKQSLGKAVKKVIKYLPQDPSKKKLVIQTIAESIGLLPQSVRKRTSRQLPYKLKEDVIKFYCRDDISYQMPGKRDTIVVWQNGTKSTHQKRILLYNLREAHQLFLSEHTGNSFYVYARFISNNPFFLGEDISSTSFSELRPKYVLIKSLMTHRVCVCAYHENVNLLLNVLQKHVKGGVCSDLKTFTSSLVCDEFNEVCMSSNCKTCSKYFKTKVQEKVIDTTLKIKWLQWTNINGRAEKQEFEGTVETCVEHLSNLIEQYLLHVFIKRTQSYLFEQMKQRTDDRKVLLQVDYAENFVMDHQDAIQLAHWSTRTLSIFTAHAWCGASNFSFALVSDNVTHDKYCIHVCLNYIISELKQYLPNLEEITFFSDGAASQFKQRYLFQNLTRMMMEHDLKLSWNFFATSHGKGVVDAIGGIVKRMVWQEIMTKKQLCRTATDFVHIANKKTSTIIVHEISQTEIDASKQKLQPLFATTKSVKNTQKLHNVVPIRLDVIECRMYGDAKSKWTAFF